MRNLTDYKIGDKLIITSRNNRGEERRGAVVFEVNYNGNGLVTYIGAEVQGLPWTGGGAFDPQALPSNKPYGLNLKVERA